MKVYDLRDRLEGKTTGNHSQTCGENWRYMCKFMQGIRSLAWTFPSFTVVGQRKALFISPISNGNILKF